MGPCGPCRAPKSCQAPGHLPPLGGPVHYLWYLMAFSIFGGGGVNDDGETDDNVFGSLLVYITTRCSKIDCIELYIM